MHDTKKLRKLLDKWRVPVGVVRRPAVNIGTGYKTTLGPLAFAVFEACVKASHVDWLIGVAAMPGLFRYDSTKDRDQNAVDCATARFRQIAEANGFPLLELVAIADLPTAAIDAIYLRSLLSKDGKADLID